MVLKGTSGANGEGILPFRELGGSGLPIPQHPPPNPISKKKTVFRHRGVRWGRGTKTGDWAGRARNGSLNLVFPSLVFLFGGIFFLGPPPL